MATAIDANGKVTAAEASLKVDEKVGAEYSLDETEKLICGYPASGEVKAQLELKIEAPEVVTHEDVVEGIEANFRRQY